VPSLGGFKWLPGHPCGERGEDQQGDEQHGHRGIRWGVLLLGQRDDRQVDAEPSARSADYQVLHQRRCTMGNLLTFCGIN